MSRVLSPILTFTDSFAIDWTNNVNNETELTVDGAHILLRFSHFVHLGVTWVMETV